MTVCPYLKIMFGSPNKKAMSFILLSDLFWAHILAPPLTLDVDILTLYSPVF